MSSSRRGRPGAARRLATVAAAVIGLVAGASVAPASADPAPWTPEPIAVPSIASGVLNAVACPTSTLCFAVGTVSSPAGTTTSFAQKWDGTTWKRVASATPAGAVTARLDAVSCVSAVNCLAVGSWTASATSTNTRPFAARWNGSGFVASSVPPASGFPSSKLSGVSCLHNAVECVAVGSATSPTSTVPFAAVYTGGSSWRALPNPPSGTTFAASLDAVSCTNVTTNDITCVAVGVARGGPLVDTWDGTAWAQASVPDTSNLTGVSCLSSTFCLAVSADPLDGNPEPSLSYDGTTWTAVPTPHADSNGVYRLRSVSCVSATDCTAVGDALHPPLTGPNVWPPAASLLEHWDGSAWTEQAVPQQTPGTNNVLTGVACGAASCTAVGRSGVAVSPAYDTDADEVDAQPLVLSGSGTTWQFQVVTGPKVTRTSSLESMSCPTSTFCVAAGSQHEATDQAPASALLEQWDGTTWTLPRVPAGTPALTSVSCGSATSCLAVGVQTVLKYNGTTWSKIATPTSTTTGTAAFLSLVSCDAATSCTAVPHFADASYHWNGVTWTSTATSLPPNSSENQVTGLSCTSGTDCVLVGWIANGATKGVAFASVRSGASWKPKMNVGPTNANYQLYGLSCTSTSACTAVGTVKSNAATATALIERWNGTAWTQQTGASTTGYAQLNSVSCTGPTACTAVGFTGPPLRTRVALVETWDGTAWTQAPAPAPAGLLGVAALNGVSCVAGARCYAAGDVAVPDGGFRPFVVSGTI